MFALKNGMEQRAQRKAFDAIFKRFDHNQNGKLFIKDYAEELKLHDIELDEPELGLLGKYTDEEGQITRHDFQLYTKESNLWKTLDKNKDGVVSDLELTSKAELAFKAADKNRDGYISKAEFQKLAKTLTKDQIDKVIAKFDANGDGKLDYEEFKKMLKK